MNDIWYYSDGGKPVGPLTLADLTANLSRISNAKDVLVWKNGSENWEKAAHVPELMALVIKPPPLPPLPPPLPPLPPALPDESLTFPTAVKPLEDRHRPINYTADGVGLKDSSLVANQSTKIKRINDILGYIATAAVIAIIAAALVLFPYYSRTTSTRVSGDVGSIPGAASIITGKVRESFVTEGMKTCLKKQEDDADNVRLSISKDKLTKYCSCYMNTLADVTTYGDMGSPPNDGTILAAYRKKVDAASTGCQNSMMKSLLGG